MGDMGWLCAIRRRSPLGCCYSVSLPLTLSARVGYIGTIYTLGERDPHSEWAVEVGKKRERGRYNTLYQTQIYTTRMNALAAGTKHCTPPVGTNDHFHTKTARPDSTLHGPEEFDLQQIADSGQTRRRRRSRPRLFC